MRCPLSPFHALCRPSCLLWSFRGPGIFHLRIIKHDQQ